MTVQELRRIMALPEENQPKAYAESFGKFPGTRIDPLVQVVLDQPDCAHLLVSLILTAQKVSEPRHYNAAGKCDL